MAQNINQLMNNPNFTKLIDQAYEDLASSVGLKGWRYANIDWVTPEQLNDFVESIGGSEQFRWLSASSLNGKTRGQILISPEGIKNASLSG
jgi:hypothetical protein